MPDQWSRAHGALARMAQQLPGIQGATPPCSSTNDWRSSSTSPEEEWRPIARGDRCAVPSGMVTVNVLPLPSSLVAAILRMQSDQFLNESESDA